ncbi:MAG: C40 family peptidase [Chitinispirillaceae bacterium]|nr:C40 family peptidase [Chitinispirillaceae bacterium]
MDDNGVRNKHGERGGEKYHPGTLLTEFQKTLAAIAAYHGKIDGWFFNKLEKALSIFHDHAVKGEFVDAKGKKVVLDNKDRLKDYRKGVINGDTIKVAEKVKEKGLKVVGNDADDETYNQQYAATMKALEGKPYIRGKNGPDSFDCSGAACWGLRKVANPSFGDYSADDLFHKFSIENKGDGVGTIKFYDYTSDGTIDHITSVISPSQMVHPSSGAGKIEIRPLDYLDSYTSKRGGKIFNRIWNWNAIKK